MNKKITWALKGYSQFSQESSNFVYTKQLHWHLRYLYLGGLRLNGLWIHSWKTPEEKNLVPDMWEAKMPPTLTYCKLFHHFQCIQCLPVFFFWNGFILHVFPPGSAGAVAALCQLCVLLLQGRKWRTGTRTAFAFWFFFLLTFAWELGARCYEGSNHILQDQGRERAEAVMGCSAAEFCSLGGELAPTIPQQPECVNVSHRYHKGAYISPA